MSTQPQLRSTTARRLLALSLAWSVLQIALIAAIHMLRPSDATAFAGTAVPSLPLCLIVAIVARLRRSNPESISRFYFYGMIFQAFSLLAISLLSVWLETAFFENKPAATLGLAIWPLFLGIMLTIALLLPWRKIDADPMVPLRMKLAKPTLRWIFRMAVLRMVYSIVQFKSSMLFESYDLTGILAFVVALLPALPVFGLLWVYNRFMQEEQDEFQRHQIHLSTLWALFGTLIIASALGPLEDHSLIFHRHPGYFHISSVFSLFLWLQFYLGFLFTFIPLTRISRQQEKKTP